MTNISNAMAAYGAARRAQSPLRVIVELYDMTLTAVARAKAQRMMGDVEKEFEALRTAAKIFSELDNCLNMADPQAKPMAEELRRYYRRTLRQLHAAKRSRGDDGIAGYSSVHRQILTMRDAWAEIAGVAPLVVAVAAQ
ncbi:MAG: flagellar protein FliS [Rhodospirillum sp.]|nr:flagellar protein FliS [Rhodospirillum sp.]MCF8491685.1 flagellar protein FliS [Rhodospirillum sp.]MCF8501074.1 flagellar protein FliS [Rhodospirillum sp.]